jgi:hypothetical protein
MYEACMMHARDALIHRYYKGVKKQFIENFKNYSDAVLTIKITGAGSANRILRWDLVVPFTAVGLSSSW